MTGTSPGPREHARFAVGAGRVPAGAAFPGSTRADVSVLFCQATFVPVGPVVLGFLSGSTARAVDGSIMGHDVETQARACLRRIDDTLREAGGDLRDVVRLRAFVVGALDDDVMTQLHAARSEVFDIEHCPASTVVSVGGLAMPGLLIEIEADAVLDAPVGSDQGSSTVGGS